MPQLSESAVLKSTGKTMVHWRRVLDRFDVKTNGHTAAAEHLRAKHELSPWWSQMVTVLYERQKGLRAHGQRPGGRFSVDVSRTIKATPAEAFDAMSDPKRLSKWFTTKARGAAKVGGAYSNGDGDKGTWQAVDRPRRLAFTWDNPGHCPGTRVEITFVRKAPASVVVRLTHDKLASAKHRAAMKEGWSWAMNSLRAWLETGEPIQHEDWLKARRRRKSASS